MLNDPNGIPWDSIKNDWPMPDSAPSDGDDEELDEPND